MATDLRELAASEDLEDLVSVDGYNEWQRAEGIPSMAGFYVDDLKTVELSPWPRKGGKGLFINLEGTGGVNDAQLVEIAPAGHSEPEHHLYEEMVYVVTGRGSTSVWYDESKKQTFEWGPGSVFAIPLNAWYQHFNGSGQQGARYVSVTNAPTVMRLFHNNDFVFGDAWQFRDRFAGEESYFNGNGKLWRRTTRKVWESNFVPDVHGMALPERPDRGGGGSNVHLGLAGNSMGAHISQFQVGMYKKGHRHGPGAHVIILGGQGFSLLWKNDDDEKKKCDWRPGAVVVPPADWFHQHFNTGAAPARYLALRMSGAHFRQTETVVRGEGTGVSLKKGGWQIEYEDEDPTVHKLFENEVKEHGATCMMKGLVAGCTGEVGVMQEGGDD
jgi:mannose-6-phosphate isomerase-like protein (cupin superfamily)